MFRWAMIVRERMLDRIHFIEEGVFIDGNRE